MSLEYNQTISLAIFILKKKFPHFLLWGYEKIYYTLATLRVQKIYFTLVWSLTRRESLLNPFFRLFGWTWSWRLYCISCKIHSQQPFLLFFFLGVPVDKLLHHCNRSFTVVICYHQGLSKFFKSLVYDCVCHTSGGSTSQSLSLSSSNPSKENM